jgi:hypothetical protein
MNQLYHSTVVSFCEDAGTALQVLRMIDNMLTLVSARLLHTPSITSIYQNTYFGTT